MASIIVDFDKAQVVHLDNRTWAIDPLPNLYGGSETWPRFALADDHESESGIFGAVNVLFRGTSIAFFGTTSEAKSSQYVIVSIDGGEPYNSFFNDPSPPSTRQWYQSPTLSDAEHVITLNRIPDVSFDYLVITAGEDTPLSGKRLIVDDGNAAITYTGSWTRNDATYTREAKDVVFSGLSHGNATRDTSTTGSSATFRFNGSFPAVYGTLNYANVGFVSVKYTLDGHSSTLNYSSTPAIQNTYTALGNNLLFSNDSVSSGEHTLNIELLESNNQIYSLDYIIYTPSFNTLAQTNVTNTTSSTSTASPSTPPYSAESGSKSIPVGAIIGGVIGGITLLVILVLLMLCRKRLVRRLSSQGSNADTSSRRGGSNAPTLEPFPMITGPDEGVMESVDNQAPLPFRKTPSPLVAPGSISDLTEASGSSLPAIPYIGALMADHKPGFGPPASDGTSEDPVSPPPYHR